MADWLSTGLKKIATPLQEKAKTLRDQTVQEMKSPKANTSSKIVLGVPLPKVPKEQQQKNLKAVVDVAKKTGEVISAPIKPVIDQFQKAQQTAVQVGQTIAPVLEGAGEVLNKTIIKPVSEAAAPVYKQAVNVLTDKIKPITDAARITLDAVKPFGDVVKDIGKFVTNPPTLKVTDNLKTGLEVQDRINKVLKGQWIDLINQPTITEDVAKTGAKAGLTTMGFAVDIIERPLRKTVLPYYFQTVTLAAKLGEKGYLTDRDIEDSKLSSEIWAGGSLEGANRTAKFVGQNVLTAMFPALATKTNAEDMADLVSYHMDTETKFREGAYQRMADHYGVSKEEVQNGINSQTIFGVPVLNVMDTFISYSASLAEARLAPVLKSIGLEKAGDVLEFVSKAVYPTALTTLGVDQAMQTGFLGDKYRVGLYETLGGDDKNLQQNIAVLEGIAVLGTMFKAAGKAVDGIKALSLLDTANKYKADIQKLNQDPALIKKVLQNAMPEYVKTVEDLTKGKLTVDDLTKIREVLLSLPPEVQKAAQEVNLKLFYKNMFDAAIAGYANSANKSLYLEADTLRTKVGNNVEAKGTIPHELAHLFEKGITESPEYKTEWESLVKSKKFSNSWNYGKGGVDGYMYKNPAEYFAEGVRKFINQPEVLKVEDKGLYDFMAKTSNEWGKMFNPPEFRAASPRDTLETPIMQSVLKSRGEQVDPYAAADKLFKVENPKELVQGVPKALVPYAIPLREYPTMESWISALEANEVKGLPYFGSAFPETQLRLFDGLNKVGGEKYVSAGDFYDQVKMKQWRTDVKAFETKEGVYDLNYKSPEKLSAHGVLGQSDFMPRQFDYKSIFRTGVDEFSKYQELGVTARERFKIPELVKIGQGSDRVVFDAGDYVIKVSKSSRGLAQNEGNYVAEQLGLIPQIVEKGKNYVVVEKVEVPDANVRAMVKELKGVDVETNKEAAYAILTKYGLNGEEIKKFDPMIGDMKRLSSWGTKDGKPILLDEGSLNGKLVEMYANQKNLNDPEFRSIYKESRDLKKQFGDTDKNTMFMPRIRDLFNSIFDKSDQDNFAKMFPEAKPLEYKSFDDLTNDLALKLEHLEKEGYDGGKFIKQEFLNQIRKAKRSEESFVGKLYDIVSPKVVDDLKKLNVPNADVEVVKPGWGMQDMEAAYLESPDSTRYPSSIIISNKDLKLMSNTYLERTLLHEIMHGTQRNPENFSSADKDLFNPGKKGFDVVADEWMSNKVEMDAEMRTKAFAQKYGVDFMPRVNPEEVPREMRVDKFNVGNKQEVAIEKIVEDLGLDVRSVKHFAEMEAGAQELLQTPEKLLMTANAKRLTDVETVALKQLVNDNYGFITQAEKILARNESTDPRLLQSKIDHAYDQITRSIQILAPGLTEQGRAVVANRIMMNKTMDYSVWAVRAQKLMGADVKDEKLKLVLDEIGRLTQAKDRLGLSSLMSSLSESTSVDKLTTILKAGWLSAPSTHIANIAGNSSFAVLETIKDVPATMIDILASQFTGKRTVTFTSLADRLGGSYKGWLMAQDVMKYGGTLDDLSRMEVFKKTNFSDTPLGRFADKSTKFVFGTLQAEDAFFKGWAENAVINQSAKVIALNEGLKGKSFDLRVSELINQPTPEMLAKAQEYKLFATFNNKNIISEIASGAKVKASANPISQMVMESTIPFVRTPTNIAARTLDYSPIGIVKGLYEAVLGKQEAAVLDLGRGITGSSIIALGALAAQKGMMTGTYPTKGDEKKKFANTGLRGGDLILGDYVFNLMRISPAGNLMQLGAALYNNVEDQGLAKGIPATAFDGMKGLTEQTFLAGLSNMLKAVQEPQQSASTYVSSAIAGMIPTVLAQLAESTDIYQRETNALTDRLLSRTPARSMLLPKLDTFGEPVESNQQKLLGSSSSFVSRALVRMFDPFGVRKLPDNVLLDEYERLSDMGIEKAYPATPSEKGTISILKDDGTKEKLEFKMSDETYNVFREVTGKLMTSAQEELLQSPEYQALDDDTKAKKLYDIYETSRDTAKALVMPLIFEQPEIQTEAAKLVTQERIKDIRLELREGRPTEAVQFVPLIPRNKKVQDLVFN